MFTSFFEKSKPINFLLVGLCMAAYYCIVNFDLVFSNFSISYFFKKLGLLIVYLLLMILVDFIVKRNRVNRPNTYAVLLFALFTMWFPNILRNGNILISGFFVLLAMRRIISMKSGLDTKKKIFDATLWICFGSLFFQWSLLFLVLVFLAVLFYAPTDYRNWLIPFVSAATVMMFVTCFTLFFSNSFFGWGQFYHLPVWEFRDFDSCPGLIPLFSIAIFSIVFVVYYFFLVQNASSTMKSSMLLLFGSWILGLLAVLFSSTKVEGEILFFIVPTAIIGANYFQTEGKRRFKNSLLLLFILLTLLFPFISSY